MPSTPRPEGAASEPEARGHAREPAPLARLIRHIVDTHHRFLRVELASLEAIASTVERDRALVDKVRRLRREQEAHLLREERVLFPLIEAIERARAEARPLPPRSFGSLQNAIMFMEEDHLAGERYLARLAALLPRGEPPFVAIAERLAAIAADLRSHIAKEERDLFPAAVRLDEA